MSFDYVFWAARKVRHVARLDGLDSFDDDFEINMGIAHMHDFPDDAYFPMSENFPDNTVLADCLDNTNTFVLISTALKEFLETRIDDATERIPVRVRDHRDRDIGQPYYIVNPIGPVDCLKGEECEIQIEDKFCIGAMGRFVVDEAAVPTARALFRIKRLARYVLIRRDIAQAIDAAGFTGNRWVEPEELLGKDIPPGLFSLPPVRKP